MTSSPSLAPRAPAGPRPQPETAQPQVSAFAYCELTAAPMRQPVSAASGPQPAPRTPNVQAPSNQASSNQSPSTQASSTQASSGQDSGTQAAREAQAREAGRQQGEREARAKFDEQLARERSALGKAVCDFWIERTDYYRRIEKEAVELALSIARKVLHREAQVDPLLLMGVVRVALERIEGATGVTFAVAPAAAAEWRRYLAAHMEAGRLPEVVEDAALAGEQCVLRTSMGSAELGLEVQLKEIEKGLMDLLAARPGSGPGEKT